MPFASVGTGDSATTVGTAPRMDRGGPRCPTLRSPHRQTPVQTPWPREMRPVAPPGARHHPLCLSPRHCTGHFECWLCMVTSVSLTRPSRARPTCKSHPCPQLPGCRSWGKAPDVAPPCEMRQPGWAPASPEPTLPRRPPHRAMPLVMENSENIVKKVKEIHPSVNSSLLTHRP